MNLTVAIVLLLVSVFLIFAVLMQEGKSHGLSGSISGTAETFYGRDKGTHLDRLLSKMTTIFSIVFVVVVLFVYIVQPDYSQSFELVGNAWKSACGYFPG